MTSDAVEMEFGRLLIRNGRAWLPLTEADIERGARAVVSDPHYRCEIARSADRHAREVGDAVLLAAVHEAEDRLDEKDGGDRKCFICAAGGHGRGGAGGGCDDEG